MDTDDCFLQPAHRRCRQSRFSRPSRRHLAQICRPAGTQRKKEVGRNKVALRPFPAQHHPNAGNAAGAAYSGLRPKNIKFSACERNRGASSLEPPKGSNHSNNRITHAAVPSYPPKPMRQSPTTPSRPALARRRHHQSARPTHSCYCA